MLDKDESIMQHKKDEAKSAASSSRTLGLKPYWQYVQRKQERLQCSENEEEIFLLNDPLLFCQVEVHRVVEDALSALPKYIRSGYTIVIEPFHISVGRCAVIQDFCGVRTCLFEKACTAIVSQRS